MKLPIKSFIVESYHMVDFLTIFCNSAIVNKKFITISDCSIYLMYLEYILKRKYFLIPFIHTLYWPCSFR